MNRLKKLLAASLMLLPALTAYADTTPQIIATTITGETLTAELRHNMVASSWYLNQTDAPVMLSIHTGNVLIDPETGKLTALPADESHPEEGKIWMEMKVTDLQNIRFLYESSVKGISVPNSIKVNILEGQIAFTNVEEPVNISIYDAAGLLEDSLSIPHDMTVDISRLGAGIHIVKAGSLTFKILTK